MANLITFVRLTLVFVITALVKYGSPSWQLLNVPLCMLILSLDGIDGIIARARNEASLFGAVFDIAADRIIEIVLWITLAMVNLVPIWIPLFVLTRGILTDILRKCHSDEGKQPFSIMQTGWGKFLVASRSMRFLLGTLKFVSFSWLLLLVPMPLIWMHFWQDHHSILQVVANILIYTTFGLSILRGIPVIVEAILY